MHTCLRSEKMMIGKKMYQPVKFSGEPSVLPTWKADLNMQIDPQ